MKVRHVHQVGRKLQVIYGETGNYDDVAPQQQSNKKKTRLVRTNEGRVYELLCLVVNINEATLVGPD